MLNQIREIVSEGSIKAIEPAVKEALDSGATPGEVLKAMSEAMDTVGEQFQKNEIYVPEMLVAAKTMQRGVGVLRPLLGENEIENNGKFIIGTVAGDLHDIGKNLVAMMIESAGFEIIDLGVDVPVERFLEALRENPDCKLIGVSALLTTTMDAMRQTVREIRKEFPHVKVMVGGAPITEEFAASIGATIYTPDAATAASVAKVMAKK